MVPGGESGPEWVSMGRLGSWVLSHPDSHRQDSCGSLEQHWGALEQGRIPADISVASFPSPPWSLAGTNASMAQLEHILVKWGPVAMPPQIPQPNPRARMCPQCCPQIRWGANTHRIFVPPGSPGASAATLRIRCARAGLHAREQRDCHTSVSAHSPTQGWGHILAGPGTAGTSRVSKPRRGGRRGSHSGVAGAGPHPVFPHWHCSADRDTGTPVLMVTLVSPQP